jgi:hypothetical protein
MLTVVSGKEIPNTLFSNRVLTMGGITERRLEGAEAVGKDVASHDVEIGVLKTNMENLTKGLDRLTKAIWGLVVMVMGTLAGFFVWYIQGLG